MKRILIMVAFAISMLTLLAACGGGTSEEKPSGQETTSASTGTEPTNQETTIGESVPTLASMVDPDGKVQTYLALMDDLAAALRRMDTTDLSADALKPILEIAADLEDYSEFFNGLDEAGKNYVFGEFGIELRKSAELVADGALVVQDRRGDEAISQALANLPAFAIATTNTGAGSPIIEAVQVPDGDISTLLTVDDVSNLAGGVGLSTGQLDLKAMSANVDPAQVEHMNSFDSLSFETADGSQALMLTVIHLDSEGAASDKMETMIEEGAPLESLAVGIGDVSGFIEANEGGIGSMVVFKKGAWVVTVHTAQSRDVTPLIDVSGVETLARLVADRL